VFINFFIKLKIILFIVLKTSFLALIYGIKYLKIYILYNNCKYNKNGYYRKSNVRNLTNFLD
jgi:hypothetical protein